MSATSQNNDNQEIDLSQISNKINGFYHSFLNSIFKGILFVKKNILIFILLIIIGVGLGFYLDSNFKSYDSEIIVAPNFGSTDYLYSKIDLLNSKIIANDTFFLKSIGLKKVDHLKSVQVEPILDIYTFVNNNTAIAGNAQNTQNFELVKLLSEDGDINKVIKDKLTSKNYYHHTIIISTDRIVESKNIVDPIIKYLNTDDYYSKIRQTTIDNIKIKMAKNDELGVELNELISKLSLALNNNNKNNNLVYYNENTPLTSLIERKVSLVNELAVQKLDLINFDSFIKETSRVTNIKKTKGLNGKMKLFLPIMFVFLFLISILFIKFYKKQAVKHLK
jgi:hypothetical protein